MREVVGSEPGLPPFLFEFSNPDRFAILTGLRQASLTPSGISKRWDIRPSEVTRHLHRLEEAGLIHRQARNEVTITGSGRLIISHLEDLEFLRINHTYFDEHDLDAVPEQFRTLRPLAGVEVITNPLEFLGRMMDAVSSAKQFVWTMATEVELPLHRDNLAQLGTGVRFRFLVQEGCVIPPVYLEAEEIEIRYLLEVPLGLKITDRVGCLILPKQGHIVYDGVLWSGEESFVTWLRWIYYNYWNQGIELL